MLLGLGLAATIPTVSKDCRGSARSQKFARGALPALHSDAHDLGRATGLVAAVARVQDVFVVLRATSSKAVSLRAARAELPAVFCLHRSYHVPAVEAPAVRVEHLARQPLHARLRLLEPA